MTNLVSNYLKSGPALSIVIIFTLLTTASVNRALAQDPIASGVTPTRQMPQIEWQVVRPFRFFAEGAEKVFEQHRNAFAEFQKLQIQQRQFLPGISKVKYRNELVGPILFSEQYLTDMATGEITGRSSGWAEKLWSGEVGKPRPPGNYIRDAANTCWDGARRKLADKCLDRDNSSSAFFPELVSVQFNIKNRQNYETFKCNWAFSDVKTGPFQLHQQNYDCSKPVWQKLKPGAKFFVKLQIVPESSWQDQKVDLISGPHKISHKLVVGFGDSYGAGEGNADVPSGFDYPPDNWIKGQNVLKRPRGTRPRRWMDWPCHRSIYSHQYRIGLQLALENPHRIISMLSYACSGAEAGEIVSDFDLKDGYVDTVNEKKIKTEFDLSGKTASQKELALIKAQARWSQLDQAVADLCRSENFRKQAEKPGKCDEFYMPVDLVLMSIGGNDAGFGGVVLYTAAKGPQSSALAFFNKAIKPETMLKWARGQQDIADCKDQAGRECKLADRYLSIGDAIGERLKVSNPNRVLIGSYPTPFGNPAKLPCENGNTQPQRRINLSMNAEKSNLNITCGELDHLQATLFKDFTFQNLLGAAIKPTGWTYVDDITKTKAFFEHGIYRVNGGDEDQRLRMPYYFALKWNRGADPQTFRAYKRRQRWYRTFNDSIMVQYQEADDRRRRQNPNLAVDFHYLSGISGFFHPTAEGQAAMADALLEQARCIVSVSHLSFCKLINSVP